MLNEAQKMHLFYCVIYLLAAVGSAIGASMNEQGFRLIFTLLCAVFLILAILSFIRFLMNKKKKI